MELTLKTEELKSILSTVKGTFGSSNFPVLNGILIEADASGTCVARSANGTEDTKVEFQARVLQDGKAVIDGGTITRIVNTFAKGDVTLQLSPNGHSVLVNHPKGEVEVNGMDPNDFPEYKELQEQSSFMLPAKEFSDALKRVGFARIMKPNGQSDIKLSGIGLIIANGKATLATSDRKRVARTTFDVPGAADINLVLAAGVVDGLSAVSGNIAVRLADNGIMFETNETVYQGPILSTGYYDVDRFFPPSAPNVAVIPKSDLIESLNRIAIIGKQGKADPDAVLTFDTDKLTLTYQSQAGRTSESFKIQYNGTPMNTKFNTDVVLTGIGHIDTDNVEVYLHDPTKPVIFYPEGKRDFSFLAMAVV